MYVIQHFSLSCKWKRDSPLYLFLQHYSQRPTSSRLYSLFSYNKHCMRVWRILIGWCSTRCPVREGTRTEMDERGEKGEEEGRGGGGGGGRVRKRRRVQYMYIPAVTCIATLHVSISLRTSFTDATPTSWSQTQLPKTQSSVVKLCINMATGLSWLW